MNVLDLFSGIGGFSLGLERAGMRTVAFCEIEPYCRAVLRKHWPGVKIYQDVTTLRACDLRYDGIRPDVICGGFPCQEVSSAASSRAVGLSGARSGLWREFARLIGEVRPRYAIVENSANLLAGANGKWFSRILGDLDSLGYDAEWHCIPAAAVGANHIRDRVWIVAYPQGRRAGQLWWGWRATESAARWNLRWQEPEPPVSRVADDVPHRVERLTAIGNAVVPRIPELIGRSIMQAEGLQ